MIDTEKLRRLDNLKRACKADRGIKAIDTMVNALCILARKSKTPCCSGCAWEKVVKPLALPLIGWERGSPPLAATDPGGPLRFVNVGELMAQMDEQKSRRTPATTETEKWLRTQEAWDDVTRSWLERLDAADPALGHGLPA